MYVRRADAIDIADARKRNESMTVELSKVALPMGLRPAAVHCEREGDAHAPSKDAKRRS